MWKIDAAIFSARKAKNVGIPIAIGKVLSSRFLRQKAGLTPRAGKRASQDSQMLPWRTIKPTLRA
jgi:hypothetical protein